MTEAATDYHRQDETSAGPPTLRLAATTRGPRVLVADDDVDMRRLLSTVLRRSGYEVVEASDGLELLDAIDATVERGHRFAAIVADVDMPGFNGIEVLVAIRCAQWHLPVVLITAFGDPSTRAAADDLGALLLEKPFAPTTLRSALDGLLRV